MSPSRQLAMSASNWQAKIFFSSVSSAYPPTCMNTRKKEEGTMTSYFVFYFIFPPLNLRQPTWPVLDGYGKVEENVASRSNAIKQLRKANGDIIGLESQQPVLKWRYSKTRKWSSVSIFASCYVTLAEHVSCLTYPILFFMKTPISKKRQADTSPYFNRICAWESISILLHYFQSCWHNRGHYYIWCFYLQILQPTEAVSALTNLGK